MAYTKTQWVDNTTPIDKDNLNKIEQGIYDNSLVVDAVTDTLNPTDTETYKTAELTEGQITDVIGVNDIVIKGQTEQDGTPTPSAPVDVNVVSGSNVVRTNNKNLLPNNAQNVTMNGLTFTINKDKSIKINGTASAYTDIYLYGGTTDTGNYLHFPKGTYSLISTLDSNLYYIAREKTKGSLVGDSSILQALASDDCYFYGFFIRANQNHVFNNFVIKPQLEKGSTATTYEPHQGKELPLDLPVENLFNYNSWLENKQNWETSRYSINQDYIISTMPTANDWASLTPPMNETASTADVEKLTWMSFPVKPNTEYTMRLKNNNKCLMQVLWFFYNENYGYIQTGNINATNTEYVIFKFTTTNATKFVSFRFDNESYSSIAKQLIISEIQFEESSKANAYTPYGTDPIELCKIGDYQDYFYKSGSKWYLHKEIGKVVLDGNASLSEQSQSGFYRYSYVNNKIRNDSSLANSLILFSNYFKAIIFNNRNTEVDETIYSVCNGYSGQNSIQFNTKTFTSLSNFKTWLATNNVSVYYLLETPTDTEITDTILISQLEAIYNAPLYEQTNITQTNNDLPMVLDITACKDNINGIKAFIRK